MLGQVQATLKQSDAALATYQRAAQLLPNSPRLFLAMASLCETKGDWQQAETLDQKVLGLQPDEPLASNNLAYLMLEHGGSVNVALTLAQTAHKGLPNLPSATDTLGWAYYHNGAFSVAAPLFEDAAKKAPGSPNFHYHLGLTYQKLNDATRARAELEKAISLDPKSPVAEQARQALGQPSGSS
jgi:Flp pilus assembly protein TadD